MGQPGFSLVAVVSSAASAREPTAGELRRRRLDAILGRLPGEPLRQVGHAGAELDLRLVAEQLTREPDVGEAVPGVARAKLARPLPLEPPPHHPPRLRR